MGLKFELRVMNVGAVQVFNFIDRKLSVKWHNKHDTLSTFTTEKIRIIAFCNLYFVAWISIKRYCLKVVLKESRHGRLFVLCQTSKHFSLSSIMPRALWLCSICLFPGTQSSPIDTEGSTDT